MNYANQAELDRQIVVRVARISKMEALSLPLEAYLSADDRERATRFRFPEDRHRFILGRTLLGDTLTRHWGFPVSPLALAYSDKGQPYLPQCRDVHFSISHTNHLVGVALSLHALVGIDLEHQNRHIQLPDLAQRIFSSRDWKAFQLLPDKEKIEAFYRAWTGKEAYLKAQGLGIAESLQEIPIPLQSRGFEPEILDLPDTEGQRLWRLQALPLSEDYKGTLVWNDPLKTVDFCVIRSDINPTS